jgi:glucokinase
MLKKMELSKNQNEMKKNYACGVDIGGSHATAAVIDLTSNSILKESIRRSAIDASGTADSIISQWVSVIKSAFAGSSEQPLNIGIAMPGPFDYEEGISYIKGQNKYEALYERNVKQMLAKALAQPGDTITFANDAACFLQGEVADGVAKGYENVLGFHTRHGFGGFAVQSWHCRRHRSLEHSFSQWYRRRLFINTLVS